MALSEKERQKLARDEERRRLAMEASDAASRGDAREMLRAMEAGLRVDGARGAGLATLAAQGGHMECLRELHRRGAAFDEEWDSPTSWRSPMMEAARVGQAEALRYMLRAGAHPDKACVADNALGLAAENGHLDCLVALLDAGASTSRRDARARTAAHRAASEGHWRCLKALARAGADLDARDDNGRTPLIMAAERGQERSVAWLVALNAPLDTREDRGHSAAMQAARWGHGACLRRLIDAGAALRLKNKEGMSILHLAVGYGPDCVELLAWAGVDVDEPSPSDIAPIQWAAERGCARSIKALAGAGANLEARNAQGLTPAHVAARSAMGKAACLEALAEAGADIESVNPKDGSTPLMMAASMCADSTSALLGWGVDLEARDHEGLTAWLRAARAGSLEGLRALAGAGANMESVTFDGKTALDLARSPAVAVEAQRLMLEASAAAAPKSARARL